VLVSTLPITFVGLCIGFEVSLGEQKLSQHFAYYRGFARTTGTIRGEEMRES